MQRYVVMLAAAILIVAVGYLGYRGRSEAFRSIYQNARSSAPGYSELRTHNGRVAGVQGDPFLADIYKRIYFLEGIARENIALNRDGPGSGNDVPRERIALENIERQTSSLRKDIGNKIAETTVVNRPTKAPLYASNPMLGLPSFPGMIPVNSATAKEYTG